MRFHKLYLNLVLSLLILLAFLPGTRNDTSAASVASIAVNTTVDEDVDNSVCSLREAIIAANTDADHYGCTGGSGVDTIDLPAGTYTLTTGNQLPYIVSDMTIAGGGAATTIIQATECNPVEEDCGLGTHLIFYVGSTYTLTLNDLTVRHGRTDSSALAGGILNFGLLTVERCAITGNKGVNGGGVQNGNIHPDRGYVDIVNSTISGNEADYGGGIYNQGDLTISKSTFSDNEANDAGAIRNDPVGILTITNSTISDNEVMGRAAGIDNLGTVTLTNVTIADNHGSFDIGLYNGLQGTLHFTNTIIANDAAWDDCDSDGTIATKTNNLVEDGSCEADLVGDPMLDPLADNGGYTWTHALLAGSPAIDAGEPSACPGMDQRGVTRPQGTGCDIGAFELQPVAADFSGSPLTGPAPLMVAFSDDSVGDYDTCSWDFGDGGTSSYCDPTHIYMGGTYTVSLTVSGLGGTDTKMRVDYIVVDHAIFLPFVLK